MRTLSRLIVKEVDVGGIGVDNEALLSSFLSDHSSAGSPCVYYEALMFKLVLSLTRLPQHAGIE